MQMLARMKQKQRKVDIRRHLIKYLSLRQDPSSLGKGTILGVYKQGNEILFCDKGPGIVDGCTIATFGLHCIELLTG